MITISATGASGMIGSRLLRLLPFNIALENNLDRANGFDILNLSDLIAKVGNKPIDCLIHFAAFTDVSAAEEQNNNRGGSCYQTNVVGTQNIIELAAKLKCRLIHISTDFVFDGAKGSSYIEEDSSSPFGWYGQTKYLAEELVKKSNLDWVIVRTAFPYLAKFPAKLDLIRSLIQEMRQGKVPVQFTDHIITPTFIDELSNALITLIKEDAAGIYHLTGNDALSDYQISQTISKIFDFPGITIPAASVKEYNSIAKRPYPLNTALSNQKFQAQFGKHFSSFEETLKIMKSQGVDVLI